VIFLFSLLLVCSKAAQQGNFDRCLAQKHLIFSFIWLVRTGDSQVTDIAVGSIHCHLCHSGEEGLWEARQLPDPKVMELAGMRLARPRQKAGAQFISAEGVNSPWPSPRPSRHGGERGVSLPLQSKLLSAERV